MKNNRILRVLSVLFIVMCMMFSMIPTTFFADKIARDIPEDAIYISTPEELIALASDCQVNTWSVDKTVVLSNDIDMTGYEFEGIPTFGGVFVGSGYTIKGLTMMEEGSVVGLFRYLQKTAIVEYLNVEGAIQPEGSQSIVGGIAGQNAGVIQNCTFNGTISGNTQIGGLVGINETTGLIENCNVYGMVYGNHFVGGVVGENHGVVRNTINDAELNTLSVQNSVSLEDITLDSLTNTESANTTTDIGGIAGASSGVIRGCTNNGAVGYQRMGYNIGGIAGTQNGYIVDCVNNGEIQGRKEVGGIVGHMEPNIILNYDADSIQILSSQLNGMESSISNIESTLKNNGENSVDQIEGLEDEMNNLQNALDALEGSYDSESGEVDEDLRDAAMNDLSDSLSDVYSESSKIQSSNVSSMGDVAGQMGDVVSQLEGIASSLSTMDENLGVSIADISDKDTETDTLGKVANCENYGEVSGDFNVGGIAGVIAEENDLDVYQDTEVVGDVSLNVTYESRAVIRGCKNMATISASKQNAGGIAGSMIIGAIFDSINLGNMDALNASYVGGVVGNSNAVVRNSDSKAIIAGTNYVGGIAGSAKEVTDCYAFVEIAAYTEKAGAIVGYTEELPDGEEDVILRNYYFLTGKDVGGIDGISYTGATDELDMAAFLQLPDLDEEFQTVKIRFCAEGKVDVVKTVAVGENLSMDEIPELAVEEGNEYDWELIPAVTSEVLGMGEIADVEYISEESLSGILFNQTYEASYDSKGTVVSSVERNEKNLSMLLAVGSFAKNTTMDIKEISSETKVQDKEVLIGYDVILSNVGVQKLHYLIPEELGDVTLFVKDASGTWGEREYVVEGSYLVFSFSDGETAFALVKDTGAMVGQVAAVIVVAIVLIVAIVFLRKTRKKAK